MIITELDKLTKECKDVSILEGIEIIKRLEFELKNSVAPGIGLAANQIGIDAKVCIIRTRDSIDLINPKIQELRGLMEFNNEGCLSFPNQWLVTKRYQETLVTDDLHPAGIVVTNIESVVVQHEVGHLYGETMHDYKITRPGPNLKCWCGSDKKYKKCHMRNVING